MSTDDNRREFTRVNINLEVNINPEGETSISSQAKDLSLNGVYFACSEKLPLGTECSIKLGLEGEELRLNVLGKVSRVEEGGLAIEFTGVPLDDLEHLRNLIRYNAEDPNVVEEEFDSHIGLKRRE